MTIRENDADYADLRRAVALLEAPTITARLSSLIGSPIEGAVKHLPKSVSTKINGAVQAALFKAGDAALWSLDNTPSTPASPGLHKLLAAGAGAAGGAFGFATLFVELPVSTTLMMRSVADIARSEGFDLGEFTTRQACIEVFAMGGPNKHDDAAETGYYITRTFTANTLQHMGKELAEIAARQGAKGFSQLTPGQAGKWLAQLIEKVASRFGIVVSQKFAAQIVPVIGALTGATINTLFIDFYQDTARGHFIIKRLEAKYGFEPIKAEYKRLAGK